MAWWEFLDSPALRETETIFIWAGVVAAGLLVAGLVIAVLWHRYKDAKRKRARS